MSSVPLDILLPSRLALLALVGCASAQSYYPYYKVDFDASRGKAKTGFTSFPIEYDPQGEGVTAGGTVEMKDADRGITTTLVGHTHRREFAFSERGRNNKATRDLMLGVSVCVGFYWL